MRLNERLMSDDETDELLRLSQRQRVYAPLREGGAKEHKELGVVRDWLEALSREGEHRYTALRMAERDPPDCLLQNKDGDAVGVEVAEFVSQAAVEINERARPGPGQRPKIEDMVYAQWDKASFIDGLAALITTKDDKVFIGGPYSELILLVHTDEPLLVTEECHRWLTEHRFDRCSQLTDVYFVHSYQPTLGYPVSKLRLGGA